jgi:hypothetical protein
MNAIQAIKKWESAISLDELSKYDIIQIVDTLNVEYSQLKLDRDALLKNDSQSVDEFNAGFDAYKAGMDLDDAEQFYRSCKREEGVPSYDSFSTGYAWAKFSTERADAALKAAK